MRKAIDTVPRNGDFVILEDDVRGTYAVARWSVEAAQWLDEEGTPSQLDATHWHPLASGQNTMAPVDEIGSLTEPRMSSTWRASGGMTAQPAMRGCRKILSAFAGAGGWLIRRRRSIFAMAACMLVGAAIGPWVYRGALGKWLPPRTASEDVAELRQALQQEREQASKLAGDVTVARREAESQTALNRQAGEAASRAKEAGDRTIVQLRQALQLELAKAEKLAGQLAEAQRDGAIQTAQAKQADTRAAEQLALKQERDKAEKLRIELAAARREAESQAATLRSASAEATQLKEASARATDELRQALQQAQDKAEKLAGELAATRQEAEAQTALARVASDEARRAAETNKRGADEQSQALRQAQDKAEKLAGELAATKQEVEVQTALVRTASDEAQRLAETNKRSADEQGKALREAQGKAEKLATELAAARLEVEAQTAAARAARDETRQLAETNKRSAEEQGQALREAQGKAEKLATELAAARQEVQSQVAVASSARDHATGVKEAAERSADERRRALQQERDKTEKLAAELAAATSRLQEQAKAKAADEGARDKQLVAVQGELQTAKAAATVARESLEAERTRAQRAEQQLASVQERTAGRGTTAPSVPVAPTKVPTVDAVQPANSATRPEAGAVRLIARANLLLDQGNIGAARNMLDRAAEMGSAEALFWLAETYDPLLLSARQTFGTQSDVAKARELYGKALAGGVDQAKLRLEALQQ